MLIVFRPSRDEISLFNTLTMHMESATLSLKNECLAAMTKKFTRILGSP